MKYEIKKIMGIYISLPPSRIVQSLVLIIQSVLLILNVKAPEPPFEIQKTKGW